MRTLAYLNATKADRIRRNRERVAQIKRERGCVVCGYNEDPNRLACIPLTPRPATVSRLVGDGAGIGTILAVVRECTIKCVNCPKGVKS